MCLIHRFGFLVALGGILIGAVAGCVANPYEIRFEGDDGGIPPDGEMAEPPPDVSDLDAEDGGCVINGTGLEECNDRDDDCNGMTDDVEAATVMNDPDNCGACEVVCFEDVSLCGVCTAAVCEYACCFGYIDCDMNPDVCEVTCSETLGGTEECDELDNDCDCETDEGFDLQIDPNNCGQCGRICGGVHSLASCVAGECVHTCDFDTSDPEGCFADVLSIPPGCEYQCPVCPPVPGLDLVEDRDNIDPAMRNLPNTPETLCNANDDDCDGVIDDGNPGGGTPCETDEGECVPGIEVCVFGTPVCGDNPGTPLVIEPVRATTESCNNLDDDCDGVTDNGFDKDEDPRYCGDCTPCVRPNTFTECNLGICEFLSCHPGWVDPDGDGICDYECTASGPEQCDGVDNDCDMVPDDGVTPPIGLCATLGACAGTTPTCADNTCEVGVVKWRCLYQPPAQTDPMSCTLVLQETLCDEIDNDCDGATDDGFPTKGAPCNDGLLGVCRSTGECVCGTGGASFNCGAGLECMITSPGGTAGTETCDGTDENCNGVLDDGAPNTMVHVTTGGEDVWIDAYEASRPDAPAPPADPTDDGSMSHRSCSKPDVLPWTNVTHTEATQACAAAGYRLCTEAEWQEACEGIPNNLYPYGMGYDPDACNGADYDPNCAAPDDDDAQPTATPYGCPPPMSSACVSIHNGADRVFDLSGNVKEWTSEQVSSPPNLTYRVRGGSFDNVASSLTCDFDFLSNEPDFFYKNLGFRCCSDLGP